MGTDEPDVVSGRRISTEKFVFINRKTEKIMKTEMSVLCILALSSALSTAHDRRPSINSELFEDFFFVEEILLCLLN